MTDLTLSTAQIAALKADRLKLIVVPLDPQPSEGSIDPIVTGQGWIVFGPEIDTESIWPPHATGDRIETPHGNLIVTDVQVKRVDEITVDEAISAGRPTHGEFLSARRWFREHFTTQHGPDAWQRNPWCAFVSVRKEGA